MLKLCKYKRYFSLPSLEKIWMIANLSELHDEVHQIFYL